MTIHIGSILPIGTVIHSMLTTSQFAAEYGDNWVLADGRTVYGSKYETITGISLIPDMRGTFLRGKGAVYNPDGDLALGTHTADKVRSHNHSLPEMNADFLSGKGYVYDNSGNYGNTTRMSSYGGNETAPVSTTVNIFIRIN